jgi:hypothetical protein
MLLAGSPKPDSGIMYCLSLIRWNMYAYKLGNYHVVSINCPCAAEVTKLNRFTIARTLHK